MLTRSASRFVSLASSSRQFLKSTRINISAGSCNSTTQADSQNELQFSIVSSDGKRMSGEQYLETVKSIVAKESEDFNVIPKNAFDVLLSEYDKVLTESADYKDKYVRAVAETENVRKRGSKQTEDAKVFAIQGFCKDLLEVADILDLAVGSVKEEDIKKGDKALKDLHDGISMTKTVLQKTFAKHNLVAVNPIGEKFDPNCHEAVFQIPAAQADKEPGTVAHVSKIGYSLKDRPIRPAQVGVVTD